MYVRFVIVKQCVHVGRILCGPCVVVLTWLQSNWDVLGRGPAPLPLSANGQLKTEKTVEKPFVVTFVVTHPLHRNTHACLGSINNYFVVSV